MDIVCATGVSDLYYMFDRIADGLYLAETQITGTVAACSANFNEAVEDKWNAAVLSLREQGHVSPSMNLTSLLKTARASAC